MPTETRFDVRKGVNTASSPEVLSENEVRRAKNLVLTEHGALVTRGGSKRIHSTAFPPGMISQLIRWFDPQANKWATVACLSLVNFLGGKWYMQNPQPNLAALLSRKFDDEAEFSSFMSGGDIARLAPVRFARWRIGSQAVLVWVSQGDGVQYWHNGAGSSTAGSPGSALVRPYKGRLYVAGDRVNPKRFTGSKINDLTVWSTGAGAVVGEAEQYDHEPINGLATAGGSLLIFKEDAIQRWSGVSSADFNLERDSEGVSRRVGCIAPDTIEEAEQLAMFLSELGPYVASEGGVQPFGEQLADQWKKANKQHIRGSVAQWNHPTHEYRLFLPIGAQTGNETGWYYNQLMGAWTGPHEMRTLLNGLPVPLAPTGTGEYELPTGESLTMFGAADGFVRVMDNGVHLDDVLADGTGGVPIQWEVEYPVLHFGSLGYEKDLDACTVAMRLPPGQQATVFWRVDGEDEESVTLDGIDTEPQNYDVGRLPSVGRRVRFGIRGEATAEVAVLGFDLEADLLRRS